MLDSANSVKPSYPLLYPHRALHRLAPQHRPPLRPMQHNLRGVRLFGSFRAEPNASPSFWTVGSGTAEPKTYTTGRMVRPPLRHQFCVRGLGKTYRELRNSARRKPVRRFAPGMNTKALDLTAARPVLAQPVALFKLNSDRPLAAQPPSRHAGCVCPSAHLPPVPAPAADRSFAHQSNARPR